METIAAGVVLGLALFGSGCVVCWIARRAGSGSLQRNAIAGVRTKSAMASDEAWQAAQKTAEGPTFLGGLTGVVSGAASLAFAALVAVGALGETVGEILILVAVIGGTVGLLGFGTYGCVAGDRAAKNVLEQAERT